MAATENFPKLPPLRLPFANVADPGTIRLRDTGITGQFPLPR